MFISCSKFSSSPTLAIVWSETLNMITKTFKIRNSLDDYSSSGVYKVIESSCWERKSSGEKGRKEKEKGKGREGKGEFSPGREIKLKNGRVGKEIKLVATLYTHEFNAYIFFMLVYRSGRPNLYLAPLQLDKIWESLFDTVIKGVHTQLMISQNWRQVSSGLCTSSSCAK